MAAFNLRLLGGFALENGAGEPDHSLSQLQPASVLAILAVCGRLGCTRERLIGMLWPEKDVSTARHNLRDALYALRRTLGRDSVPGSGELLHIDPDAVTSDVQQFMAALEEGRPADAVAVYAGPLLDGFHLHDAFGFERWLDRERARLHREHQGAIGDLAQAAEAREEWEAAATWLARGISADPCDSRLVVRRMVALARSGDRANALQEGEAHRDLLKAELEIVPDAAFLEALERIRRGEIGPSARPAQPGSVREPAAAGAREAPLQPADVDIGQGAQQPIREGSGGGKRSRRRRRAIAGLVVVLALAITAVLAVYAGPTRARVVNPEQVTTATGVERSPSWSPDGGALAFHSSRDGDFDIWVTGLGTGELVNRTADDPSEDMHPRWSPDGRWIAFFSDRRAGGYFVMPAAGGTARQVGAWPASEMYPVPPAWSPAGTELAIARGQRQAPWIELLDPASGERRRLPLPARPRNNVVLDLSWSPDGRFLAYGRAISPIAATAELWVTGVDDGRSVQLSDGSHRDVSPTWSPDSRQLFFVSDRGGSRDLWRLEIGGSGRPEGPPLQVTAGLELLEVALSPDGRRIAYTKGRRVHTVFRAPVLDDRPVTWSDVTRLTLDEADFESIDVDREGRLLLSSDRSGNWDIYLRPAGGGALRRLTSHPALDAGPSWSPDGRGIVFYSSRSGDREVWTLSLDAEPPRQVTRGRTQKLYPRWSPDGREVVVSGAGLSAVAVEDGAIRALTASNQDFHPDWSPDGRWIAFSSTRDGPPRLWRVPSTGGEAEPLTDVPGRAARWSADGKRIYFLPPEGFGDTIRVLSVGTGEVRPLTDLRGRSGRLGRTGLAVNGESIYFTWQESRGDIWVADLLPPLGR